MAVIDMTFLGCWVFFIFRGEMVNLKIETLQVFCFYLYLELSERERALSFHLNLRLIGW